MGACTPAPPPLLQACKASLKLTLQPCMSVSWRQERCPGCHPQNPNPPWHPLELRVVKCSSQGWLSPNLSLAQALLHLWKAAIRSQCFPESSSNRMHIGKEKKKKIPVKSQARPCDDPQDSSARSGHGHESAGQVCETPLQMAEGGEELKLLEYPQESCSSSLPAGKVFVGEARAGLPVSRSPVWLMGFLPLHNQCVKQRAI